MAGERQRKASDKVEQPPVPEVAEAQRRPPASVTDEAGQGPAPGPLTEEGDSEGRQKVPRDYLLSRSERLLGIPHHELVGALVASGNDDEELTLNAARKAHAEFIASATTAEEE
jgi:hypothetical protein